MNLNDIYKGFLHVYFMNKGSFFILGLLLMVSFSFALPNDAFNSIDFTYPTNYSTLNVNNSQFLRGYTPQQVADLYSELWQETGSDIYYDSGNVGIGTTTPTTKLHLYGSTPILRVEASGGSQEAQLHLDAHDNTGSQGIYFTRVSSTVGYYGKIGWT